MLWRWIGLGMFVEWRVGHHEAIREQRARPKPVQGFGYGTAVGLGFGMTAIIVIPAWYVGEQTA